MTPRALQALAGLAFGVPSVCDVLCSEMSAAAVCSEPSRVDRVALACDPGTQSGWTLVVRYDGVITPLVAWVIGQRAVSGTRAVAMQPARAPGFRDHLALVQAVGNFCDEEMPAPVVVCEDWFAGPNGSTVRDTAKQFYFVEAAAQSEGLTFRPVMHSTWKKSYLGRGNMKSEDALVAYAGRGYRDHPHVQRWAGKVASQLTRSDDSAALGLATHWLSTEAT